MQAKATYKDIWALSHPIITGAVAQTVLGVTDTAFLGRVGETELAASAIGGVFYYLLIMLGMAIAIGSQILIARYAGAKDNEGITHLFRQSFLLLVAIGLAMFFVAHFIAPFLFPFIINDVKVKDAAVTYILCRSFGLLLWIPLLSVRAFLIGTGSTRLIGVQAVFMCLLNIVLGYILIFGKGGMPPMGIAGAAYASAISEILASLLTLFVIKYHKKYTSFNLFANIQAHGVTLKKILHISSPIVLQNFLSMGAWFVFFIFIEKLNTHALAISNVVRASYMIMMTPAWGFSAASNSMTSNLIGQGKHEEVFVLLKKIITLSTVFIASYIIILAFFPSFILGIITNDAILIRDSRHCYYIVCVATIVLSAGLNLLSAVSGTGATRTAMYIEVINIICYLIFIFATCIVIKTSVEIAWLSEILYWALMGLLALYYLKTNKWRKINI